MSEFKTVGEIAELRKQKFNPLDFPDKPERYVALEHIESSSGKLFGYGYSNETTSIKSVFHTGDTLFGKLRPYLKKYWYATFDGVCATEILPIVSKENIESKFLFYAMQQYKVIDYVTTRTFGTKMPRTSWNELKEINIFVPQLKEQQKIADILSTVDTQIEQTEQMIEQTKELKHGLMQQLLTKGIGHTEFKESIFGSIPITWKITNFDALTIDHKQGYYTKESYVESGVKIVRITDLQNPRINYKNMPMLDISDKDFDAYKVTEGDFLFARSGAIGRYGIVENLVDKAIFASYLIRFKFDLTKVKNRFLGYFYESSFSEQQLKMITQGSSNININANNIKALKIVLPPLKEQEKIVEILSSVDDQIDIYEQERAKYEELKKGLMQQLLTGKIRVKVDE